MFTIWLTTLVVTTLLLICAMHVYWAAGGRMGSYAAVPDWPQAPRLVTPDPSAEAHATPNSSPGPAAARAFTPGPGMTLLVALALAVAAALVAWRGGFILPVSRHGLLSAAIVAMALIFLARAVGDFRLVGFFKDDCPSLFARMDTWLYSPLCVALGTSLLAIARA
jgi:hypothetical protein